MFIQSSIGSIDTLPSSKYGVGMKKMIVPINNFFWTSTIHLSSGSSDLLYHVVLLGSSGSSGSSVGKLSLVFWLLSLQFFNSSVMLHHNLITY
jgi:hypothetical protein